MESGQTGKSAIISGIQTDAQTEKDKIIQLATQQAAESRQYAEKKAASIIDKAREKGEKDAEKIRQKIISDVDIQIKRDFLKVHDDVVKDIFRRTEKKLAAMADDGSWRSVLEDWITEAAVGLGADSAKINASRRERELIDEIMLSHAAERAAKLLGKEVSLSLSEENPLDLQGIVLTASDGRIAYNNQVKTRLLRNRRKIQALIYEALFPDNK